MWFRCRTLGTKSQLELCVPVFVSVCFLHRLLPLPSPITTTAHSLSVSNVLFASIYATESCSWTARGSSHSSSSSSSHTHAVQPFVFVCSHLLKMKKKDKKNRTQREAPFVGSLSAHRTTTPVHCCMCALRRVKHSLMFGLGFSFVSLLLFCKIMIVWNALVLVSCRLNLR